MSHRDSLIKTNKELSKPMDFFNVGFTGNVGSGGDIGGWVELARTTTGSALSDISVGSLADKEYYMVLTNITGKNNSGVNWQTRMGNGSIDTNSNYAMRYTLNGGSDSGSGGVNSIQSGTNPTNLPQFNVAYISNLSGKSKLYMGNDINQNTAGTGSTPKRGEYSGIWANNNPLDIIGATTGSGSYTMSSGSEIVVLGWDPEDKHTDNFWEELASVDLSGGASSTLSSGTITAKKYLWIQYYTNSIASSIRPDFIFNSDTTSSYSNTYNYDDPNSNPNNGTESVAPNENSHFAGVSPNTNPFFGNFFIINKSANEKLSIGHVMSRGGSGAGTGIAQNVALAQKWTRTSGSGTGDASDQITKITLTNDASANFGTKTYLRVWGSN